MEYHVAVWIADKCYWWTDFTPSEFSVWVKEEYPNCEYNHEKSKTHQNKFYYTGVKDSKNVEIVVIERPCVEEKLAG